MSAPGPVDLHVHTWYCGDRDNSRKLAKINGLRYKLLPHDEPWVEGSHVLHLLDHPGYNRHVYPEATRQFPLQRT